MENKDQIKEKKRLDHIVNKDKNNEKSKSHYHNNLEHNRLKSLRYRTFHKEILARKAAIWAKANRPRINAYMRSYQKNRILIDAQYRLLRNLRNRHYKIFEKAVNGGVVKKSSLELLGCTALEWKIHLQSQFEPGMCWENYGYGRDKWNVDHIIPLSTLNLSNPLQYAKAFHFTNTAPLWQPLNQKKSNKLNYNICTSARQAV